MKVFVGGQDGEGKDGPFMIARNQHHRHSGVGHLQHPVFGRCFNGGWGRFDGFIRLLRARRFSRFSARTASGMMG